jgi:translation initiation factor 2B subunit (eIF-2B alpha/beta/delta family)
MCQFFKEARKTIKFELIVLETAPTYDGHRTAKELAQAGIKCNLVQDSAVFAVMSRVDKVILSTHGIMANGGIISQSGALMIAHAAQAHKVPYFAMGSIYKLTPLHPTDQ